MPFNSVPEELPSPVPEPQSSSRSDEPHNERLSIPVSEPQLNLPSDPHPWDIANFIGKDLGRDLSYSLLKNVYKPDETSTFPSTEYHEKGRKKQRAFQYAWLKRFPGLVYSKALDGCYCIYCVVFRPDTTSSLIALPYRNWKKATEHFNRHFHNKSNDDTKTSGHGYKRHAECVTKGLSVMNVIENKQVQFTFNLNNYFTATGIMQVSFDI